MARRSVILLAVVACLGVGGCASARSAGDADAPSASLGAGLESHAGRWIGTLWETGGSLYQGSSSLEVVLTEDGHWKGRIGEAPAAGRARLEGNRLVVTGTAGGPEGPQVPVYVQLVGDDERRWGEMAALFAGRRAPATVELRRSAPVELQREAP